MTNTIEDIRRIARSARPNLESLLNCNPINPKICQALSESGIEAKLVEGTVSKKYDAHGEEHMFIKIPYSEVECNKQIIVDGAIDQFCAENHDEGRVFELLGPREKLPEVAVLTPDDELFHAFNEEKLAEERLF